MNQKILNQIITFIIATILFYMLLNYNVFHIGDFVAQTSKDYLEISPPQENETDSENIYLNVPASTITTNKTGHFAANDTNDLENLCATINICNKIIFNGTFSSTEKYNYTKIIDKVIQFINNNQLQNTKIEDVLSTIEIQKENGNRR